MPSNEERIEKLKDQLMSKNLSQAEIDKIKQKIEFLRSLDE